MTKTIPNPQIQCHRKHSHSPIHTWQERLKILTIIHSFPLQRLAFFAAVIGCMLFKSMDSKTIATATTMLTTIQANCLFIHSALCALFVLIFMFKLHRNRNDYKYKVNTCLGSWRRGQRQWQWQRQRQLQHDWIR